MKKYFIFSIFLFVNLINAQVGIGTTDPKVTLQVEGNPTSTSATDGFIPPKLQRAQLIAKTSYGTDQTGAVVYVTDTSGTTNTATAKVTSIGYYFWDGDSWEPIGNSGDGRNIYTEDGTLSANRTVTQGTRNLAFTSTATSGTSHFTVDGNTFNIDANNNRVGIGTATPSGRLHVASDDGKDAVFSMGSNTASENMDLDIYRYRGTASSPSIVQNGDNIGGLRFSGLNLAASGTVAPFTIMGEVNAVADGVITSTSAPGALNFRTTTNGTLTSSTKMTIKNSGNVGIGTTDPGLSLDVTTTSGIGLKASNTSPWDHLYFNAGTTSSTISAGGADSGLQFRVGSGASGSYGGQTYTTVATMMPSGNVGIGTILPNASLQFANTIANRKIVLWEGINNDHQYYGFGINNNILRYQINSTSDNHIFYAGTSSSTSNELMRIQGNGNVGIGANDPQQKLDVNGNVRIRSNNTIYYQDLADYRLVIREDYESAVTGWSNNTRTSCLGQNILGGYNVLSTSTNQKTFDLTGITHTTVKIKFSYYAIDSWDGETAYVRISGTGGGWNRVVNYTEITRENIVGGTWIDGIYYGEIEVPHTGNSLTVIVGSTLNQTPDDESYGIDNLEIWVR